MSIIFIYRCSINIEVTDSTAKESENELRKLIRSVRFLELQNTLKSRPNEDSTKNFGNLVNFIGKNSSIYYNCLSHICYILCSMYLTKALS